ncbi:MAG TPA: PAS domain S-box protein [Gaiellaceae bacterium]|nr:PAS domain S-box protein [Gaiellaceae bacterium]
MNRILVVLGVALLTLEAAVAVALIATVDSTTGGAVGGALGGAAGGAAGGTQLVGAATETDWTVIGLAITAGVAFVVSGLVALTLRPENRTGIYLAATGYVWFFAALQESSNDWLFTIGFIVGNLVWVPFTALVLAYPTGQFETRLQRAWPIVTGVVLVVPAVLAALLDARPASDCPECADSAIALTDDADAGNVLELFTSAAGLVLVAIVITMLVRRWRRASPAMRKLAWPVIAAGIAALGAIGLLVVSNELSASASDALQPVFFVAFAAVPVSFLFGVLRTRLARSTVSELVVALEAGEPLRDALAGALGDPELDVVYWLDWRRGLGGAGWVDLQGRSVHEPTPDEHRAVKLVERNGVRVAAIVYDRGLDAEPEHLEAVTAAAALALQNDRLQAELRAEVGFISTVTNTAPSLLVNIGTDGRVRTINAAALEAAGLEDEELARGQHFWNLFIEPSERDGMIARFHALAPDYPAGEYENTFTNARGEVRTIYWRAAPVTDAAGRVVSIVSGGLDITERRKRELELERERDATTTALESIPSIAVVLDRDGTIRDRDVDNPGVGANRAFRQALGWRDHELVGTHFLDLVVDDDGTAAAAIAVAATGGASEEVESELRCADGSVRAFLWTAVPVADVTGRAEALVLVSGIEVTERRRLEVEKERERAFLNAIANNAPSMLCLIDAQGRLTHGGANIAFEHTLGYQPGEIGDQILWEEFVDPGEADEVRELVSAVATGEPPREHDNTWVTRDGRRLSVAWTCTPLPEIDERRLFLITGVDITERKRITEDLHASRARLVRAEDRARRALERNLHDGAQQRLVALSVALRLVESRLASDPAAATELLTGAREELTQALAELRELARGIHPAVLTDRGLRPALEMLASRTPVPVEVVAPDERFAPEAEATAYYVIAETLTNVAKYAQATAARVEVTQANGSLRVFVSDNGIGGADPTAGSGLRGLADRVAVLDGTLEFASPPGGGTSIRAEIPLSEESVEIHSAP